jgi:hypothetical protein
MVLDGSPCRYFVPAEVYDHLMLCPFQKNSPAFASSGPASPLLCLGEEGETFNDVEYSPEPERDPNN